jgi:hypothetical protein
VTGNERNTIISYIGYKIGENRYFFTPADDELLQIWAPIDEVKSVQAKEAAPVQPPRGSVARYAKITFEADRQNKDLGVLLIDEQILPTLQALDPKTVEHLKAVNEEDYTYFYRNPVQLALALAERPKRIENELRITENNIESERKALLDEWTRNGDRRQFWYTTTQFDSIYDAWAHGQEKGANLDDFKHIMFGGPAPPLDARPAVAAAAERPAAAARPVAGRL